MKEAIKVVAKLFATVAGYVRARRASLWSLLKWLVSAIKQRRSPSFSSRWRGKFRAAERKNDPRYDALAKKYLE